MLTVFSNIIVVFTVILAGFLAAKGGILPRESKPYLVNLLLVITSPCLIIDSMTSSIMADEMMTDISQVILVSLGYFIIVPLLLILPSRLFRRTPKEDIGALMVIMTGMNSGFMGFPITRAVFGKYFLLLMVVQNIVLNFYLYFISIIQLNYGSRTGIRPGKMLKSLVNPCTIALLFGVLLMFGRIQVPKPVGQFVSLVGDMTTPLAMIIVGIELAGSDFKKMLTNIDLVIASLINVLVIPIFTFLMVYRLPITDNAKLTVVFASCFPCAMALSGISAKEGKNAELVSQGIAITTLFSLFTLPVASELLLSFFGI